MNVPDERGILKTQARFCGGTKMERYTWGRIQNGSNRLVVEVAGEKA